MILVRLIILNLLVYPFVSADSFPYTFQSTGNPVDSIEFKILLKPGKFLRIKNGIEAYRAIVRETAEKMGLAISTKKLKKPKKREIQFYDTSTFELRKHGFLLRHRKEKGAPTSGVSLKFRHSEYNRVKEADLGVAPGYEFKTKFEEDIGAKDGTHTTSVYSRSSTVEIPPLEGSTLQDYIDIFPGLKSLALVPEVLLKKVNGLTVLEKKYKLDSIEFGGDERVGTDLSIWTLQGEDQPLIAEFSFKSKTPDSHTQNIARRFFLTLITKSKTWRQKGLTKTALIYKGRPRTARVPLGAFQELYDY
ncbi:hypothetical protein HOF92_14300 [bacterium]|jgi:hypothetical protein|nr:hypothetical protein [bacterium]